MVLMQAILISMMLWVALHLIYSGFNLSQPSKWRNHLGIDARTFQQQCCGRLRQNQIYRRELPPPPGEVATLLATIIRRRKFRRGGPKEDERNPVQASEATPV